MKNLQDFLTHKSIHKKVTGYLFNPNNYEGWSKGQWFVKALGFDPESPEHLKMLKKQIKFDPDIAVFTEDTEWGARFGQKLTIIGPNGKTISDIRSHWQKDKVSGMITLLTLLPPKKNR
jgi:filamentous hemagglutinin